MPSGLIEKDGGVRARRDLRGDLGQVQVHRLGVAARHDEGGAFALVRADRAENVGRSGSLVAWRARARSAPGPAAILFFWPIRASSANQISMSRGSTPFSRPISSRRMGRLF